MPFGVFYGIVWSGSQFVAVGGKNLGTGGPNTAVTYTSPDGLTWTERYDGLPGIDLHDVVWSGSQFVAVGGADILTSPDGVTWTHRTSNTARNLWGIAWSGKQFVAVGDGGTSVTSTDDGLTWTSQPSAGSNIHLKDITWSGSQFVAVGSGTTYKEGGIYTSPNGITWTLRFTLPGNADLWGIAWSGSQFAAVGSNNSYAGTILTSPDGINWSVAYTGSTQLLGIAWSGGQFVVVGPSNLTLTSPDGVSWTPRNTVVHNSFYDIAWSGNRLVAVSNGGSTYNSPFVYTSDCPWGDNTPLKANLWSLIGLPATPTSTTITSVFGDDLTGVYGTDWRVYQRNNVAPYVDTYLSNINSTLERGVSYWIKHKTLSTDLDLESGSIGGGGGVNLVTNGGFEDPGPGITIPSGGFHTYYAGQTFPGWRVDSGNVDIQTGAHGLPHSGLYALDLAGSAAGSISQTLSTVPGQQYTLELWYAAHPYHPYGGPAQARVLWGGAEVGLLSIATLNQMTRAQFVVTATSSTTTLSLVGLSPNGGIIVDDVSVSVYTPHALVRNSNCRSTNGCYAITLTAPSSGVLYNQISFPLPYPVAWWDVVVEVDGVAYTPSGANAYVNKTYWVWNGSSYKTYDDVTPGKVGILQPWQGLQVEVKAASYGKTVRLLFPAIPKTSQVLPQTDPVASQDHGAPTGWVTTLLDWLIAPATAEEEPVQTLGQRGREAIGEREREARREAHGRAFQESRAWNVRLLAEDAEEGLRNDDALLGQLDDAKVGYDAYDLRLPPADQGPPDSPADPATVLHVVFPHPDWGIWAGDYVTDYRPTNRGAPAATWRFELRTDTPGRVVRLRWDGPAAVLKRSVLLDEDLGARYPAGDIQYAEDGVSVVMHRTVRHFTWRYTGKPGGFPARD